MKKFIEYTAVERHGLHLRKMLRFIVRLRVSQRQSAGPKVHLTTLAAQVTAALKGPEFTLKMIENTCVVIGFEADKATLDWFAPMVRQARQGPDFKFPSAKTIGEMIQFLEVERQVLRDNGVQRCAIKAIDAADVRRERNRLAQAAKRLRDGATPQSASKAALAREQNISRSSLYPRPKTTVSSAVTLEALPTPKPAPSITVSATVSSSLLEARDTFVSTYPSSSNNHESVAAIAAGGMGRRR